MFVWPYKLVICLSVYLLFCPSTKNSYHRKTVHSKTTQSTAVQGNARQCRGNTKHSIGTVLWCIERAYTLSIQLLLCKIITYDIDVRTNSSRTHCDSQKKQTVSDKERTYDTNSDSGKWTSCLTGCLEMNKSRTHCNIYWNRGDSDNDDDDMMLIRMKNFVVIMILSIFCYADNSSSKEWLWRKRATSF